MDYDKNYCLDSTLLEYSGIGKGDFRHSPIEIILEDGSFVTNTAKEFGITGTLVFTDTDGEANGGDFATLAVDIAKLPKSQTKEGDGAWNMGEYEVTADVKLEKK